MKRLWCLAIQRRGQRFEVRIFNVFDTYKPDEPIEFELPNLASVEELIRSIEPVSHVSSTYMEVSGLGAFLRIGTLPIEPLDELLRRALEELLSHQGSTGLATTFLSRAEILQRIPTVGESGLSSTNDG